MVSRSAEAPVRSRRKGRFVNVGRNDPCPCGSGKKYKNCHLARGAERASVERSLSLAPAGDAPCRHLGIPAEAELPDLWEVDFVPLQRAIPRRFATQDDGRNRRSSG
jgi:hypothetical protein